MNRPTFVAALCVLLLSACGDASTEDAGVDSGGGAMDAATGDAGRDSGLNDPDSGASDSGAADAGGSDGGDPGDAGPGDAGSSDAGPSDAGPSDAGASDAGSSDAGPSDAGDLPDGASGTCVGADLTYCDSVDDCAPVGCGCSCSGCGGFSYEDIVRSGCTDAYYTARDCTPSLICPLVCCPTRTVTCVDNVCGVQEGDPL